MNSPHPKNHLSRRGFLQSSLGVGVALAVRPLWGLTDARPSGPSHRTLVFDHDWQFLGKAAQPSAPITVSLPHSVAKLSWQDWNPESWEDVWLYRKNFHPLPDSQGFRTFLKFEGAMVTADVSVNGAAFPQHKGGYLPFSHEITSLLKDDNLVEVRLDSRFQNVPPEGNPKGVHSVDYYVPGGLIRGASLYAVP